MRITDINKAELLPQRQKLGDHINGRGEVKRRLVEYYWKRNFYKTDEYTRMKRIVWSSIGKRANDVLSKLLSEFSHSPISVRWLFEEMLTQVRFEGDEVYKVRWVKQKPSMWELYIDKNGIIARGKRTKPFKPRHDARKHHSFLTKRKKDKKETLLNKERREQALVLMINRPDIYKFYLSLTSEAEKQRVVMRESSNFRPVDPFRLQWTNGIGYEKVMKTQTDYNREVKWAQWRYRRAQREKKEAEQKLKILQPQIEALEQGEWDIFYESNAYLYSVQKECHHYAQP